MDNQTKQVERRQEEIEIRTVTEEKQETTSRTVTSGETEIKEHAEAEHTETAEQTRLDEALHRQEEVNRNLSKEL